MMEAAMTQQDMIRIAAFMALGVIGIVVDLYAMKWLDRRRNRAALNRFWKGHKQ